MRNPNAFLQKSRNVARMLSHTTPTNTILKVLANAASRIEEMRCVREGRENKARFTEDTSAQHHSGNLWELITQSIVPARRHVTYDNSCPTVCQERILRLRGKTKAKNNTLKDIPKGMRSPTLDY